MAFELISWIYISFICLVWGDWFVHIIFRGRLNISAFGFPAICFAGMAVIGVVALYVSLFVPLTGWVKIFLQAPAFLYFLKRSNRVAFFKQLKTLLPKLSGSDILLLSVCIIMVLFLSTSPIIHPDSLNYHIYSIQIFNRYGMIPGVVNLQLELGFQSLWFAVMAVFDFSFLQPFVSYPLSGCVLCWFIIFLVSGPERDRTGLRPARGDIHAAWYMLLLVFSILSWTQLRLTASSASPDFIVTICILFAFYFFLQGGLSGKADYFFYFAIFFAGIAISVKLSAIAIILIPGYIFVCSVIKKRFLFVRNGILLLALLLLPVVIRNIVSTGYPLYPSSFANVFHSDWKLDEFKLIQFQHYITGYARYPIIKADVASAYAAPWLLMWWHHLYISDKMVILLIAAGVVLNLIFLKKWIKVFSVGERWGLIISVTGAVIWFLNAPDPRFGTGFLLPLIYFLFAPFLLSVKFSGNGWLLKGILCVKFTSAILIVAYILYRSIYFFHPEQLIFPDGIKQTTTVQADCRDHIKKMLFRDSQALTQIPDSCRTILLRGASIKDGFKPVN